MKRAVMIIAFDKFRDEEYFEPKSVLENAGIKVTTASTQLGQAKGKLGAAAKVDMLLSDLNPADFDAVIFVGGPGSYSYHDDPLAQKTAKDAAGSGKALAAICAAVGTLANAGLLKGKKATCFSGISGMLEKGGAVYTGKGLEIDGKIITADGPKHARQFGEAIAKMLS